MEFRNSREALGPKSANFEAQPYTISRGSSSEIHFPQATSLLEDLDLHLTRFQSYGKAFIKRQNLSPDAYLQMAIQLAYFRDMGERCLAGTTHYLVVLWQSGLI